MIPQPKKTQGPARLFSELAAGQWRAFTFETGAFLLHVPSSSVLEVPLALARHVQGLAPSSEAEEDLRALEQSLPAATPRAAPPVEIRAIAINVVQNCNLRCTYCYAGDGDYGKNGLMEPELAKAIVKFFATGKERLHLSFFGGEPLLNLKLIKEVIAYCESLPECKFSFALTTNGTLLTESVLSYLSEKNVKVTMSFDGKGLQAAQRLNKDRRTNSERLVERKLDAFKEQLAALRSFRLRTTVTKQTLPLLEEAIVSTIYSRSFSLAVSRHATEVKALAFGEADIDALAQVLKRVVDRLLAGKDYSKLLLFGPIAKHLRAIHHGDTGSQFCGAGINYLSVSTEGRFYLCHRFTENESEAVGSLSEGLNTAKLAGFAAHRRATSEPCSGCWMREWCGGGCFHENKSATGNTFDPDPLFCKLQAAEIEQALRVYTHIQRDAPELL